MRSIQLRLRAITLLWLLVQTAQVAALVPVDCCAAHRASAETTGFACHREAAVSHCPLAAAGKRCPMHAHHGSAGSPQTGSSTECAMRGTCGGPFAALLALLSNQAVLTRPAQATTTPDKAAAAPVLRENILARLDPPNPRPPRA